MDIPRDVNKAPNNDTVTKVLGLLTAYSKILVVQCTKIGSNQLHNIRKKLRGEAVLIRGKTLLLRTALREHIRSHPEMSPLLPHVKGEVGLVFTNGNVFDIRTKITAEKIVKAAHPLARAPEDVFIYGQTILEPSQAGIVANSRPVATRIRKGKVDIVTNYKLISKGKRIKQADADLLNLMQIMPFTYVAKVTHIYANGMVLDDDIMEAAEKQILRSVGSGLNNVAAVSLAIGVPNKSTIYHLISHAVNNVRAVSLWMEH